ncbi:MAG: TSUP family transporter [Bdellovibrionales bacterium]|nr:TSUP family transporter [Bdellovibrionales bacterium]
MQSTILIVAGFFAGFVDAIVGGGGLITLPTLLTLGIPPLTALGTNKALGVSTALASSGKYIRSGNVRWNQLKWMIPLCLMTSMSGAFVATQIDASILSKALPLVLMLIFIFLLLKKDFGTMEKEKIPGVWGIIFIPAISFYDGLIGPGTGSFLCLAFISIYGYALLNASANSRIINLTSNIGAIVLFSYHGVIDLQMAWPACISSFIGGYLGAKYAISIGSKKIRPFFILSIAALLLKLLWNQY